MIRMGKTRRRKQDGIVRTVDLSVGMSTFSDCMKRNLLFCNDLLLV